MRTFLGAILGCLLTIIVVYMHDTMITSRATSTVAGGSTAGAQQRIVNWDVAQMNGAASSKTFISPGCA